MIVTNSPISTKWPITSHHKNETTTCNVVNIGPGLRQSQRCGGVNDQYRIHVVEFWPDVKYLWHWIAWRSSFQDLRIYIAPDVSLGCSLHLSRFSSIINSHDIAEQFLNLTNYPVVKSELLLLIVQNIFFVVLRKLDHISIKGSENIQKHVY